ncbi:MAG: sigma-54-dependent Fis family transcriptional regulator [Desulfosarcina sp.]|nr:sigma-54-dependent Fis family transcriptional regulator [Desulfosarcina sp.]MBC2742740.1 sigma-54-dependent Fis family transcriptional regulator [Desulfosarcina sp.]MBC2765650.1 sigma-54-dependent Fis family transcriptional regulator [Desulfosarcina sp.]
MHHKVLIAEDESRMREVITMLLSDLPLDFVEARDGKEAIDLFDNDTFSLVVTDIKLPKVNGMEILQHVKMMDSELPVIVITAYGSIENAVEAIHLGAFDYVTKPFKEDRLRDCVEKALRISRLTSEVRYLRKEIERKYNFGNIIGNSPQICDVLRQAGRVAGTNTTVLVTGESGTGKELLSKALHFNSARAAGPFLPVNCAAIPAPLLESELFGYEEGAFTGAVRRQKGKLEQASGGTLFMDEIGDMAVDVQAKLLRVLESHSFQRLGGSTPINTDVRLIAATNQNLEKLVNKKLFREDLYYRINVFPLHIPPLRDRQEDIGPLANAFIRDFSTAFGRKMPKLSDKALSLLVAHPWKGNIRELKNVIERALILCKGDQITTRHLILQTSNNLRFNEMDMEKMVNVMINGGGFDIVDLETRFVRRAMHLAKNNVSKAARLLGLTRPTLRYRLEKYNIDISE